MTGDRQDLSPPEGGGRSQTDADRSSLDEDLFDFESDKLAERPTGDLRQGTRNLAQLVETTEGEPKTPPPTEPEREPAAGPRGTPSSPAPSDPDEDLFRFDELFHPPDHRVDPPLHHADLFPDTERGAAGATAHHEPEPEPEPQTEPEASPRPHAPLAAEHDAPRAPSPPPPTPRQESEPEPSLADARNSVAEALSAARAAREALHDHPATLVPASADGGWNKRMVIGIAVVFLLVNVSLVLVAMQLGKSMNSALDGVREDLTRSISTAHADVPIQVIVPSNGTAPAVGGASTQPVQRTELTDIASRELELAHQELAQAAFSGARRRLYRLLANRDRLLITNEVLAEAEFLVAESYLQEARNRDLMEADE